MTDAMMNESAGQSQEQHTVITCPVCFDEVDTRNQMYIVPCRDLSHPGFHKECLMSYVEAKVNEGTSMLFIFENNRI